MEAILKQILNEVSGLKEGQQQLSKEVSSLKEDINRLESKVDKISIEGQKDTLSVIQLIDQKVNPLATKEDIGKLNSKFEMLDSRLFDQEAELYELKAVK